MKPDEEILSLHQQRLNRLDPLRRTAREVKDAYHGEIVLPLPEMDRATKPTVANVIALGLDQTARRICSTMPTPLFLADGDTARARERARDKNSLVRFWWAKENLRVKMMRLARHYSAYACAILSLTPGEEERACWRVRDPLDALPPDSDYDTCEVTDCLFDSARTMGWMRANYPWVSFPTRGQVSDETGSTLIEYIDAEERVLMASWTTTDSWGASTMKSVRLGRAPIELDYCPVAVGWRPGLARPSGQMDGVIGPYWAQAMLQSLEMIAVKRSVFPDEWFLGQNGTQAKIVQHADGLRGQIGIVTDGTPWVNTAQPGFMAPQAIDRYERDMRVTGGIPADFGGESASNVRTGRRGDSILSATVDFAIQEAQEVFAPLLLCADMIAIDYDRKWYNKSKTFYLRLGDREVAKTYTPGELWANPRHTVEYAFSGTDANGLVISLAQRLGVEMMSHRSAMFIDPLVDDPDSEHDQIQVEKLEQALLGGLLAQAQQGNLPPHDLARIMKLVSEDVNLADAVERAQREAQERQAEQAPPTAPEAQPGIANPGAGAEAQPAIPEAGPGQRNLAGLLRSLNVSQLQGAQ